MGSLLGSECARPWDRLMPLRSKYSLLKSLKGIQSPCIIEWCLKADRCNLTLEWELNVEIWVAKSMRVCSAGGKATRLCDTQKVLYAITAEA